MALALLQFAGESVHVTAPSLDSQSYTQLYICWASQHFRAQHFKNRTLL